jgi:hypothetical protein
VSLSTLILVLVVLAAVSFAIIWRNIQQHKRPRRRFKVGRSSRTRRHPVRGKTMSYTEMAREKRDAAKKNQPKRR